MKILVIDIGGTNIKIALSDKEGNISQFSEFPSESKKGGSFMVKNLIERIKKRKYKFDKIGISTAGQVDMETGKILYANENIPNYTDTALKDIFETTFNVPVKVINDVNAAALGEAHYGGGKHHNDFLCVTFGTGVGGAIVLNRQMYVGKNGLAGEIGHMVLYPKGRRCNCGLRGCYEQYASTTALVREAQKVEKCYKDGRTIFKYLQTDKELQKVYHQWIENVCLGLVNLIHTFNPDAILLGGGIMEQSLITNDIQRNLHHVIMDSFSNVRIQQAQLGNKAGLLGAASLHID